MLIGEVIKSKGPLLWAIIAGICSILALAISTAQYRYSIKGIDQATTLSCTYNVNQSQCAASQSKGWVKGKMYYGINQKYGTTKTKYDFYYRVGNGSYIKLKSNGYGTRNNTYYGEYYGHSTTGRSKYGYKLVKKTNKNVKSQMQIDMFIQ